MKKIASISSRLRLAMDEANINQTDLALKAGIDRSAISSYLTERYSPKQDNILRLARALGVSEVWLMGYDVPMHKELAPLTDILPPPATRKVPLVGTIACGEPIEAIENYDEYAEAPEYIHCDFALKCEGDSMIGARIYDGDIVYIRTQPTVENGQIAAVLIEDKATLKKVYYQEEGVMLMPANPEMPPLYYDSERMDNSRIRVLGLAVGFTSTNL